MNPAELFSFSPWDCGLSGTISDSLYILVGLQILDLSDNKLEGEVSASLDSLKARRDAGYKVDLNNN